MRLTSTIVCFLSLTLVACAVDFGPCGTKTTEPGFIVASQRSPPVYLDVSRIITGELNVTFPQSFSQRFALYSRSLIHNSFYPGCASFYSGCLTLLNSSLPSNSDYDDYDYDKAASAVEIESKAQPMEPEPSLVIDPNCTSSVQQQFTPLADGSLALLSSPDLCVGLSADAGTILVASCTVLPAAQRFYWVPWN